MAKVSAIEKNKKRKDLSKRYSNKRSELKKIANDISLPLEVRFEAMVKLSQLPRNSAKNRYRNRCAITGRPRGYYRQFDMSRISLRELGSWGLIPGLLKSSW